MVLASRVRNIERLCCLFLSHFCTTHLLPRTENLFKSSYSIHFYISVTTFAQLTPFQEEKRNSNLHIFQIFHIFYIFLSHFAQLTFFQEAKMNSKKILHIFKIISGDPRALQVRIRLISLKTSKLEFKSI